MKRVKVPGVIFLLCILVACKKNNNADETGDGGKWPAGSCHLTSSIGLRLRGNPPDSILYSYDNDQIVQAVASWGIYNYTYNAHGLASMTLTSTDPGRHPAHVQRISYDATGRMTGRVYVYTVGGNPVQIDSVTYGYSGNQIVQLKVYAGSPAPLSLEEEYSYTYTGGNITNMHQVIHYTNTTSVSDIAFSYDSRPNAFRHPHPQLYLLEPQLGSITQQYFVFYLSENNIINSMQTNVGTNNQAAFAYTYDSRDNLETWTSGTGPVATLARLRFQCP